jgi:ribonucleoside-diphosphate reductase alpha chain
MYIVNEIGRNVMQGGSRRSAIYGSLNWRHQDVHEFLTAKDWSPEVKDLKEKDFNFPASLDMTNISLNYDNDFLYAVEEKGEIPETFKMNVEQALRTGEPGFSFNFGDQEDETLRNACTEVTSEDDSDVCNLGSINLAAIGSKEELARVVEVASKFLVCGTIRADLPYQKVRDVREKNRRLGLGIMGLHEWLLARGKGYKVDDELREWLQIYKDESERSANEHCDRLYLSRPIAYRAIAPTGSIGILAGTTTGIEPLYAVAYKRRYLTDGTRWKHEFVVDGTAEHLINSLGVKPDKIETALTLAATPEKRIALQADVQD